MPCHQKRTGGDNDERILQKAWKGAVARSQTVHYPSDGAQQHGVNEKIGEARAASDHDLIGH